MYDSMPNAFPVVCNRLYSSSLSYIIQHRICGNSLILEFYSYRSYTVYKCGYDITLPYYWR